LNFILNNINKELSKIDKNFLLRKIPPFDYGMEKYVKINGENLLNLASNNYLGLSNERFIVKSSIKAIEKYGTSSGASRIVCGNYKIYDELEIEIAKFKNTEAALIYNSGYTANLSIISSVANKNTVIFSDKLNHASIIDGILLSRAKHIRYKHNDMEHLDYCINKYKEFPEKIIVSDSIFSMDGDIACLETIVELAEKYNIFTIIDEAHATGVFGKGRGLVFEKSLENKIDIQMGTFSKGLGSFGAYVACSNTIKEYLVNKSRAFIFSTSLPPSVVGANLGALKYIRNHPEISKKLTDISEDFRCFLKKEKYDIQNSQTQIIPIVLKENEITLKAANFLMENKILVGAIRPPTVPVNTSRLRISLRADLNNSEIEYIKNVFIKLKKELTL
jgi:8-amino-7-oxononanoate synthase